MKMKAQFIMKRIATTTLLPAAIGALTPAAAFAQAAYPSKPVRIISIFSPGGGNDVICRLVAQKLTERFKQQVIVENRVGANGIIGTEAAARSVPDGYTFTLIPSGHAVNASMYRKLPFDSVKDFTTITLAGSSPLVLAVHPSLPARNVKELIALAKARPGQLTYVSSGIGASGHLAGALFETMTGVTMQHVPYKGMSLAVSDLMGGQVTMTFGTSLSVIPHVQTGRLRALAVTGAQRSAALPQLPTIAESGVPGYEAGLWYGFVGPANIPADIVQKLQTEIAAVLAQADVKEKLASQGLDTRSTTPDEFQRILVADIKRWAAIVQKLGLHAD